MVQMVNNLIKVVPAAFLGKALKGLAQGYVEERAPNVTIDMIRTARASGRSISDALGMADPDVQSFLAAVAQRTPWLFDEITFDVFLEWVAGSNPSLVTKVLSDRDLMLWGKHSWDEGIVEIRRLAST